MLVLQQQFAAFRASRDYQVAADATRIETLENKIATLAEENVMLKGRIGALEAIIAEKADVEKADEAIIVEKADVKKVGIKRSENQGIADEGFEKIPTTSSKSCALRPASFAEED